MNLSSKSFFFTRKKISLLSKQGVNIIMGEVTWKRLLNFKREFDWRLGSYDAFCKYNF